MLEVRSSNPYGSALLYWWITKLSQQVAAHAVVDVAGGAPVNRAAGPVVPVRASVLAHPARVRRAQAVVQRACGDVGYPAQQSPRCPPWAAASLDVLRAGITARFTSARTQAGSRGSSVVCVTRAVVSAGSSISRVTSSSTTTAHQLSTIVS